MNQPSQKQMDWIKVLVQERRQGLTPAPEWLKPPTTSWEASRLINNLKGIKKDIYNIPDPEVGFYKVGDTVVFAYRARSGHITSKSFAGRWEYTGKKALTGCTPDAMMTDKEVAELGRTISKDGKGTCVVCLAEGRDPTLTDARSIAAGYGATCAARFGWHYPSQQEAETIIASWAVTVTMEDMNRV
jgi:hypothetical protein